MGAFDHLLKPSESTQRQIYVSVAGPGAGSGAGKDGRLWTGLDGTDMAAALVSGAVASIRSKFPHESAPQVVQRITTTVTDLGRPGCDEKTGYGALSLRKALTHRTIPANVPRSVHDGLEKVLTALGEGPGAGTGSSAISGGKRWPGLRKGLAAVAALLFIILVVLIAVVVSRRRSPSLSPLGTSGRSSFLSGPAPYPSPHAGAMRTIGRVRITPYFRLRGEASEDIYRLAKSGDAGCLVQDYSSIGQRVDRQRQCPASPVWTTLDLMAGADLP